MIEVRKGVNMICDFLKATPIPDWYAHIVKIKIIKRE